MLRFSVSATLLIVRSLYTKVNTVKQTSKRCSSTSPSTAPPHKSTRTDVLSPTTQTPDAGENHSETNKQEMQTENTEGPSSPTVSPTTRRKSWRRATMTRRSLPALPNQYQGEMSWLCCTLSSGYHFCNLNTYLCVYCSFVQEHKCIFITSPET